MYPWLRSARVVLAARCGRRLGPLEESRLCLRVWPNDLDAYLHLNNGRQLTLMDLGRVDLWLRTGLMKLCLARRWRPLVASSTIRYRQPIQPFSRLILRSRLRGWDLRALYCEHTFEHKGQVASHSFVRLVVLGPDGKIAPEQVGRAMGLDLASPPLPPEVVPWQGG